MKSLVEAIAKREDVSPKEGEGKYGKGVTFAVEKNKKYPLDTEAHARAALSYWGMPTNRAKCWAEDQKTIGGKIRAAAKKFGIETSDGGDKTESALVYAAATVDLEGETPPSIMYMPKGDWKISPAVHGKAKIVSIKVDETVAATLQQDLTKRLAEPPRPYAGFDHQPGSASFIPKAFRWDAEQGVMLDVDWTKPGEEAVKGRGHSYFSPTFLLSDKGDVAGLPSTGEIGSLTNNPAFRRIQKIAASADDDEGEESKMVKLTDKLVELEVITAEQAADADEELLVRAVTGLHEALATVQAANARLISEKTALAAKAIEVQKAEALSIVQAAIAEGKIPAKVQSAIDFWTAQLTSNPEQAKKALATLHPAPVLEKMVDVKMSDTKRVVGGQSEADLVQAQHLVIHEIQEAHPNLSYTDAFNKAKREHPEVFPVEA